MEPLSFQETLETTFEELERRHKSEDIVMRGLATGFVDLDRLLGGWPAGKFTAVGADPIADRESFVLQSALHLAVEKGTVAYGLAGRTADEAARHALLSVADVNRDAVRSDASERDWSQLVQAAGRLKKVADLFWLSCDGANWNEFESAARELIEEEACDALFVDEIGALTGPGENRGDVASRLARFARELEIAVVGGFPLAETSGSPFSVDRAPVGVAEAATTLVHLVVPETDDSEHDGRIAELRVLKNPDGPTHTVRLAHFPETHRFENYHPDLSEQQRHAEMFALGPHREE